MAAFRVIVVGGGPVGIILAHMLSSAKIDYVLVEKRDGISTWAGAAVLLWPSAVRLVHQLGLWDALQPVSTDMAGFHVVGPGGVDNATIQSNNIENLGYAPAAFDRGQFLKIMYENLPDSKSRIHTNKLVSDIVNEERGVIVKFADGSAEKGSIVIGADGVWSTTRRIIATQAPPDAVEDSFWEADYVLVYFKSLPIEGLAKGIMLERHDQGWTLQGGNHMGQSLWVLVRPVPNAQERLKYSEEDKEAFLRDILDERIYNEVCLKQLWDTRIVSGMTRVDQGVAKAWHWNRVVMVGDANHKPNPLVGAGIVAGAEAAAVLTNKLHELLQTTSDPSTEQLAGIFEAYESDYKKRATVYVDIGKRAVNKMTRKTWLDKAFSQYLDRWVRQILEDKLGTPFVAGAPKLDFLAFPDEKFGKTRWAAK